jgi:hypothetical protein
MRPHGLSKTIVIKEKICGVSRETKSIYEFASDLLFLKIVIHV